MLINTKLAERLIESLIAGAQLIVEQIGDSEIADGLQELSEELDDLLAQESFGHITDE